MDEATILQGLEKRNELLERILEITRAQPALIAEENQIPLLDNIEKRQKYIDALTELSRLMEGEDALQKSARAKELHRRAKELNREILRQDKENERLGQKRIEELQAQLRRIRDGKTAFSGYEKGPGDPGSTYFDTKK